MTEALVQAWLPARPLRAADMSKIDLEVPFEISDGKLEIMTPPGVWHQSATRRIERMLETRYPYATGDVPVTVGENGRRPDVVAVLQTEDELLRQRIESFEVEMVQVAVEVISHDKDQWQDRKSVARDREVKFREYATAGIPEYWIVDRDPDDPTDAVIEVYHLRDSRYAPVLVAKLSQLTSGAVELPGR
jgi:Uma2 family endonuclease